METYVHKDLDGDLLTIADCRPGTALVKALAGVEVDAAKLPEIVGALYEACGLPSPVILGRPPALAEGVEWHPDRDSLLRVSRDLDRLTVRTAMDGGAAVLTPAAARSMAAALATLADEAEAEPDPEEVDDLAAAIHAAKHPGGCTLGASEEHRAAAVAALRWMNAKAARDDS